MDPGKILDLMRPLVMVVDGLGTIVDARGGVGGFFGHQPDEILARNVLEFVAPHKQEEAATFFVDLAGEPLRTVVTPMPFRTTVVALDGSQHDVDVIATGCADDPEVWGWVIVIVPLSLQSSSARSLNAELAGMPREQVRRQLAEELCVDNDGTDQRWYLVDLLADGAPRVSAPLRDEGFGIVLQDAIVGGWRPWQGSAVSVSDLSGVSAIRPESGDPEVPHGVLTALRDRGWNQLTCFEVELDDADVAVYVHVGASAPDDNDAVKTNVVSRIRSLIDITRLLIARWRDQDRLEAAALSDSLTGLSNRDAFGDAVADADDRCSVLYIDIDDFKDVNDRWGHAIGDRVLVEIARRVGVSCRPEDVVARFGGDEFVVLLRNVDDITARTIGERIVASMAPPLRLDPGPERVSVSVGLAPVTSECDPVDVADRAMLKAKRQGRDRLVVA